MFIQSNKFFMDPWYSLIRFRINMYILCGESEVRTSDAFSAFLDAFSAKL